MIKIEFIISYLDINHEPVENYNPYDHPVILNWDMPIPRVGEFVEIEDFLQDDTIHTAMTCEVIFVKYCKDRVIVCINED